MKGTTDEEGTKQMLVYGCEIKLGTVTESVTPFFEEIEKGLAHCFGGPLV